MQRLTNEQITKIMANAYVLHQMNDSNSQIASVAASNFVIVELLARQLEQFSNLKVD
jgi:hypothetical protein